MSNIVTYPLNGIDYDAADAAGFTATRTSGVYSSEEDFAVTAAGGLSVTVSAGVGWVHPARFEGYSVIMREAETLTLALSDGQRPRIDRIVLRYDAAARKSSLLVLQGTPDTQPTAPGISRTALLYDLCLAQITRPAGSTTIVAGNITDTRLDPALCGVMRDGVTGIPTEELIASARERINALEETASAAAKEADASKTAAAQSEANAKAYKEAAATSESNAAGSASASAGFAAAAARSQSAAAGSASAASGSASAAEKSKTAAATSESNAAKHEAAAKKAADEAGAKAGTDKTLRIENAPADAKATGDALAKKVDKDVILDEDGNVLFYSKAAVDKLLEGKLDIKPDSAEGLGSGLEIDGAGKLGTSFYNRGHVTNANEATNSGWYSIPADATNAPIADAGQILAFSSPGHVWPCQIFASSSAYGLYYRAFNGTNWNAWMAVGVVASGSNYVRFGDGTQICWGSGTMPVKNSEGRSCFLQYSGILTVNFPAAFSSNPAGFVNGGNHAAYWNGNSPWTTTTSIRVSIASNGTTDSMQYSYIAIGRWK